MQPGGRGGPAFRSGANLLAAELWMRRFVGAAPWSPAGWWTTTAWAFLAVTALWTVTTAVAEATAVTDAVNSRKAETFAAWCAFAEGKVTGCLGKRWLMQRRAR
jgi:hypothetical protein